MGLKKNENEGICYWLLKRKGQAYRRQEIDKLEREITLLENQLLAAPSKSIVDEIDNKTSKLNNIYDNFRQGLRIRSRAEWFEEGEQKTVF